MDNNNELFNDSEKRILFNSDTRFSLNTVDGKTTLSGYAMIWGAVSGDRGGFKVRLLKNSAQFTEPTYALFSHDWRAMLAFTEDNSLRITSDDVGVKVEMELADTQAGKDAAYYVSRKMVKGMSFAMLAGGKYYVSNENDTKIHNYESFSSDEVTITPIPAFAETSIQVKDNADTENAIVAPSAEATKRISRHSKDIAADSAKYRKFKLDSEMALRLAESQQNESK